jgi:hypothetical protein
MKKQFELDKFRGRGGYQSVNTSAKLDYKAPEQCKHTASKPRVIGELLTHFTVDVNDSRLQFHSRDLHELPWPPESRKLPTGRSKSGF